MTTTNPLGWTTTTAFETIRGNKTTSTDENGNVTSYQYDASGRVTGVWDPMRPQATNPVPTQATAYTISQTAPSSIMRTSINGIGEAVSSYEIYDGLGRIRQTQKPSPGGGTIATDTFYNTTGATRLVNNDYYYATNPGSTLMIPNVAVPSSTQYDYDGAGRITTNTALAWDNQTLWATNISYIGADTTTTTGPGNESAARTIVNAAGKTVSQLLYHGTTPTGTPDTTGYSYDALGRMTTMKDTAGNQWTWTLDPAGRQTSATDPDTGTTATSYDPSGRIAMTTDAAGTLTSYSYDVLDRAISTSVTPQGGTAHTLVTSTFDGEKKGQLSTTTRNNGPNYDQPVTTAVSGYNAAYLPKTTTVTLPAGLTGYAGTYTTSSFYTKTGNLSAQTSPAIGGLAAETIYPFYDSFENPSAVKDAAGNFLVGSTQYGHLNQIATYQQFDRNNNSMTLDTTGVNQVYFSWDATTGRLANQSATNIAKGVTSDLGTTNYTYTPAGKLSAREVSYPSRPGAPDDYQCYGYDYASRLAAVWTAAAKNCNTAPTPASTSVTGLGGPAPYAQTYTYTAAGDRSQVKRFDATGNLAATENYTYPAAGQPGPHRLQSLTSTPATGTATTSTFSWDAAGRMSGRAGETLSYTADGKLATTTGASTLPVNPNPSATAGTPPAPVTGAGSTGTRYYDAGGTLVGLTDGTGTTITIGSITAHSTPAGVKTATKTYSFAGKTIGQRTAAAGAVKLAFILSDGVDTAQTIVQPTSGATLVTAQTRYTDPMGLARGATQSAVGSGAYATAPAGTNGVGSNAANPAGYGAPNGYIGGLADTISTLTHLGARDLDPVLGVFTSPDPLLDPTEPNKYSPYAYSGQDPVNHSDPSGLDYGIDDAIGIGVIMGVGLIGEWLATQVHLPPIQLPTQWPWEQHSSSGTSSAAEASSSYPAIPASADSTISFDRPMVTATGPDEGYVAEYPQATGTFFPAIPQRPSSTNDHGARNDGAALAAANAIMHAASQAATQAIGNQNQARNALGQFTSGSGGESADAANGRRAHEAYGLTLGDEGYVFNRAKIPGSQLRPDAINPDLRIVRELKPNNAKAIAEGWRQVRKYQQLLQDATGEAWQAFVDTYEK
ncbi:RHS repeat-associated core domain-containing protein [Arthrobacter sp. NPDC058127]|uniref:RHS repeat-associated core domain-containing protein n=1 Tax=Arthrobacter sp. NPDC058127 TaxID=3346351 RepID=UPI0036E60EBF